jgi:hypothetical protein
MAERITSGKVNPAINKDQPSTTATTSVTITHEMIARRAYEIWETKGRRSGRIKRDGSGKNKTGRIKRDGSDLT